MAIMDGWQPYNGINTEERENGGDECYISKSHGMYEKLLNTQPNIKTLEYHAWFINAQYNHHPTNRHTKSAHAKRTLKHMSFPSAWSFRSTQSTTILLSRFVRDNDRHAFRETLSRSSAAKNGDITNGSRFTHTHDAKHVGVSIVQAPRNYPLYSPTMQPVNSAIAPITDRHIYVRRLNGLTARVRIDYYVRFVRSQYDCYVSYTMPVVVGSTQLNCFCLSMVAFVWQTPLCSIAVPNMTCEHHHCAQLVISYSIELIVRSKKIHPSPTSTFY